MHTRRRCGCWRYSAGSGARRSGICCIGWQGRRRCIRQYCIRGEAGSTERLLRHFANKGDDHGRCLFTLATFRAGEPTRCLAHSKGGVRCFDFGTGRFGCSCSRDAVVTRLQPLEIMARLCTHRFLSAVRAVGRAGRSGATRVARPGFARVEHYLRLNVDHFCMARGCFVPALTTNRK